MIPWLPPTSKTKMYVKKELYIFFVQYKARLRFNHDYVEPLLSTLRVPGYVPWDYLVNIVEVSQGRQVHKHPMLWQGCKRRHDDMRATCPWQQRESLMGWDSHSLGATGEPRFCIRYFQGSLAHRRAKENFSEDMFMGEIIEADEPDEAQKGKRRGWLITRKFKTAAAPRYFVPHAPSA